MTIVIICSGPIWRNVHAKKIEYGELFNKCLTKILSGYLKMMKLEVIKMVSLLCFSVFLNSFAMNMEDFIK